MARRRCGIPDASSHDESDGKGLEELEDEIIDLRAEGLEVVQ
jgi:hypothetical protein